MIDHKKKLDPLEWDKLLDENPVVIDMRNRFEYHMGTFKDSKSLDLINFSDIKEVLKSNNDIDKKKDIAIFCTGGISCLLYTSPSPRDGLLSRMPSSA